MKKISIIVPVYNVYEYIDKCLKSLINQEYDDYEVIVVNDGTKDNSQEIIDKYVKDYPSLVKSYIKENGGLSSARNYGINKAEGKYLLFVDSDDYIEPYTLSKLSTYIDNDKSDIYVFNMNIVGNGQVIKKDTFNKNIDNINKRYIISNPSACNKLIKKELFTKNNILFMENVYYEDLATMPIFGSLTDNITFIDETFYNYYKREDSIMNKIEYKPKMDTIFDVLDNTKKYLIKDYKEEIEYLYIDHLLRYASIRYLDCGRCERQLNQIIKTMDDNFPSWNKNVYYKMLDIKKKMMIELIYKKKYKTIKILRKF